MDMTYIKIHIARSLNVCASLAIAITLLSFTKVHANDEPTHPTISVTGNAEVRVVPDEAVLTFSIDSRDKDLNAVVKDNDDRIKAVTAFLKESKIVDEDIRTEVISIQPIFKPAQNSFRKVVPTAVLPQGFNNASLLPVLPPPVAKPPQPEDKMAKAKPIGYTARRSLSITIKDLKSFENIYRGLIGKGVNNVGGIQFRTTELRKHRDAARLQAVKAAREKAKAMAGELGATLSSVQTIRENHIPSHPQFFQNSISTAQAFNQPNRSIAAGVIEIKASVHVVFRLSNTELDMSKKQK